MYLITFFSSAFALYASERKSFPKGVRRIFLVIALLIPSIVAGLRDYTIGYDVLLYGNSWFERACTYPSLSYYLSKAAEFDIGLGYALINYIVSLFSHNPHVFYFVFELLLLTLVYFSLVPLRDKISLPFAFLIYYFMWYNLSLNILRQSLALAIGLLSYRFVYEKKTGCFFLCVILAFSAHSSAFVIVVYYLAELLLKSRYGNLVKVFFVSGSLVMLLFYKQIFSLLVRYNILSGERYGHYLTDSTSGGRMIRIAFWLVLFMFFVLYKDKATRNIKIPYQGKEDPTFIRALVARLLSFGSWSQISMLYFWTTISFILSIMMLIASNEIIRLAYYFDILTVFSLPYLAKRFHFKADIRLKYLTVLVPVMAFWFITFILRNGAATFPYVFFFNGRG